MAIDTSNINFIDYLWTKKNDDNTVSGIRLSKDNLPSTLNPIASKTFEHVWSTPKTTEEAKNFTGSSTTGGSNDSRDYYIYFGSIKPTGTSYSDSWHIKFRLVTECETDTNYRSEHLCILYGAGVEVSYAIFNNIYHVGYKNLYYIFLNGVTSTGFNNGFSHLFGINFANTNSKNLNNSNYKRKFYIEILEQENCKINFFDDWVSVRNYSPATNATNYYGYINSSNTVIGMREYNAANNGLQETGDANNYYQLFSYFRPIAGGIGIQGASLISQLQDGTWASFTTNNTQATNSTKTNSPNTTDSFVLGAPIWYYSSNTILASGSIAAGDYVYSAINAIDTRYVSNYYNTTSGNANSFAYNGSGYKQSSAYIKINPDFDNGTYKISSLILNERDLRGSGNGYYIYIGRTFSKSTYEINLEVQNPIFYWNGSHFIKYSDYQYRIITDRFTSLHYNYVDISNAQTITGKKTFTKIPTFNGIDFSLDGHTHKASEVSGVVTTRDIFCIDLLKNVIRSEINLEGGQTNIGNDLLTMIYGTLAEEGVVGIALSLNNGTSELWFALVNDITDEVAYQSYSSIYDDTSTAWFEDLNNLFNYHIEVFTVTYEELYNLSSYYDITTVRNNFNCLCTIRLKEDKTAWIVEQ